MFDPVCKTPQYEVRETFSTFQGWETFIKLTPPCFFLSFRSVTMGPQNGSQLTRHTTSWSLPQWELSDDCLNTSLVTMWMVCLHVYPLVHSCVNRLLKQAVSLRSDGSFQNSKHKKHKRWQTQNIRTRCTYTVQRFSVTWKNSEQHTKMWKRNQRFNLQIVLQLHPFVRNILFKLNHFLWPLCDHVVELNLKCLLTQHYNYCI